MASCGAHKHEVIGVTGFIGSGKSMVSRFLALQLACSCLDADKIARDLMEPGMEGWASIKKYNPKYIMADGRLDRLLLRNDIFSKPVVREAVDCLIHPIVRDKLVDALAADRGTRVVVEVPLLFESGWNDIFDRIILVYAEKDVCLQRVVARDRVAAEQAEQSYQSQMGAAEKIKRADHVIDNSGSLWNTQLQLLHLAGILKG